MSKTIKDRRKELQAREEALKSQLATNEDDLRSKAKSAGKIALATGAAAVLVYWIYKAFFDDDKPKKKKKRSKRSFLKGTLMTYALPHITAFLDDFLDISDLKKEINKEVEETKSKN